MLRQIGSSHWDAALYRLRDHPEWSFILVLGGVEDMTPETLADHLKSEWCYVIHRTGETFEKVTYHHGTRCFSERS